eukprot:870569-Pyramimonas_sp.AAC.1
MLAAPFRHPAASRDALPGLQNEPRRSRIPLLLREAWPSVAECERLRGQDDEEQDETEEDDAEDEQ